MRDSFSKGSLSQMADTAGCDIDTRVWPSWGASCIEGGSLHMHPPHPACETIREAMPGPAVLVPARAHEAVSHVKSGWARTGREDVPVLRPWRAAGHDIHCSTAAGHSGIPGSFRAAEPACKPCHLRRGPGKKARLVPMQRAKSQRRRFNRDGCSARAFLLERPGQRAQR